MVARPAVSASTRNLSEWKSGQLVPDLLSQKLWRWDPAVHVTTPQAMCCQVQGLWQPKLPLSPPSELFGKTEEAHCALLLRSHSLLNNFISMPTAFLHSTVLVCLPFSIQQTFTERIRWAGCCVGCYECKCSNRASLCSERTAVVLEQPSSKAIVIFSWAHLGASPQSSWIPEALDTTDLASSLLRNSLLL